MAIRRTELSHEVSDMLLKLGFDDEFSEIIGDQMNTDFTARMMVGYLRDAKPKRAEEIADEMLGILALRDRCKEKQIGKRRYHPLEDMFIRGLEIEWKEELLDSYVADIAPIRNLKKLSFSRRITFFTGENGSGKSTLLEGIAIALGLNPEGGTQNYMFHTYDDYSDLGECIKFTRGGYRSEFSYFLRAESFYNMATVTNMEYRSAWTPDYHAQSHGESFLEFIQYYNKPGLYLLDEPEAALSPQRQLSLLIILVKMAKQGSQFIISTHSPILLGTPDAEIISFDDGELHTVSYEETQSYQITKLFLENRERMLKNLLEEE